jgi:menaquinone-dependent protoporphyrinogen oxidase
MSVLVTYASKQGATGKIAERIGDVLRDRGVGTEVRPMKAVTNATHYEAFVIGSALDLGSWLKDATRFVERNQLVLAERPVWLFSRGPLAAGGMPPELERIATAVHVREHRIFRGEPDHMKFDVRDLRVWGLPRNGRLLVEGDYRDWPAVEAWAAKIADELEKERARIPAGSSASSQA